MSKCKKCDDELKVRTLRVVTGTCWSCNGQTKAALVEYYDGQERIFGPRQFTAKEMKFAIKNGATIEDKFSKTAGESYLANECQKCKVIQGDSFLGSKFADPAKRNGLPSIELRTDYCFVCDRNPSLGEEFLISFFKEVGIKAKYQMKLLEDPNPNINECSIADFYLKDYNIYVEFLGKWKDDDGRREYLDKMKAYAANKKNCVYIWPENLGFIHYYFDKEIQKVMKDHKMNSELEKYRFFKLRKAIGYRFIWLPFSISVPFLFYSQIELIPLIAISSIMICHHCWCVINNYLDIFRRNNFPLDRLLE